MKKFLNFFAAAVLVAAPVALTSCDDGNEAPADYDQAGTQLLDINGTEWEIGASGNSWGYWTAGDEDYPATACVFIAASDPSRPKVVYNYQIVFASEADPYPGQVITEDSYLLNFLSSTPTNYDSRMYNGGEMVVLATDRDARTVTVQLNDLSYIGQAAYVPSMKDAQYTFNGTLVLPYNFQ